MFGAPLKKPENILEDTDELLKSCNKFQCWRHRGGPIARVPGALMHHPRWNPRHAAKFQVLHPLPPLPPPH